MKTASKEKMSSFQQAKKAFIADHTTKLLADPLRRLNALTAIEKAFKEKFPEALKDEDLFHNISKPYFSKLYECLKGSSLSGAEKSVIAGLYKFSK